MAHPALIRRCVLVTREQLRARTIDCDRVRVQAAFVDRIEVESTSLAAIAYSTDGVLEVEFKNAGVYRFFLVPPALWAQLEAAESKGTFFNEAIKDRFPFEKLEQQHAAPAPDTLLSDLERSLQALAKKT